MWAWVLSSLGLLGTYFTAKKFWWGWLFLFILNFAWVYYALATKQYGFLLASAVYGVLYWKTMVKWRRERLTKDTKPR